MLNNINNRIFIVGCARSGTTLLQSLLALHPYIFTFPESHFFKYLESKSPLLSKIKIASSSTGKILDQFLKEIGSEEIRLRRWKGDLNIKKYARAFIEGCDQTTIQNGKYLWIEKTPGHLYYIDLIENLVPRAKFIHLIRNGEDTIASLYEVTNNYPCEWGGAKSLEYCIKRWINDTLISQHLCDNYNQHTLVSYENLVSFPEDILKKLCNFLNIKYYNYMLLRPRSSTNIIRTGEHWKHNVYKNIATTHKRKFKKILSLCEQQHVKQSISAISMPEQQNSSKLP